MSRSGGGRPQGSALFVRNISDRVRYDEIKKLFEKYGRIVDVTIPLDYYTRVPKGFAFVEYEDPRDAEDAMYHLDRVRLHGRELEIEFARGDRKTPSDMRNRDREHRFDEYPERGRGSRSPADKRGSSFGRNPRRRSRSPIRRSVSKCYSRSNSSRRTFSNRRSRSLSKINSFRRTTQQSRSRTSSMERGRKHDMYHRPSFENRSPHNRRRIESSLSPR